MAYAKITHRFPDGTTVTLTVGTDPVDNAYPDRLAELRAQVRELYREAVPDAEPAPDTTD